MASSDNAHIEGVSPAPEDTTVLTILAGAASEQSPKLTPISEVPFLPFINPRTGKKTEALIIDKDDSRLTPEFLQKFGLAMAVDDQLQPLEDSDEVVATWTDDLRRKQPYRGRGYATEIVEVGAEEVRQKAEKAAKEREESEKVEKERKEAKDKALREEMDKKKKMKWEAEKEEGQRRKQARREAAERRRNFQADIKADYDLDFVISKTKGKK
jgi:hypothetical protein